jgi:hypothetical protein
MTDTFVEVHIDTIAELGVGFELPEHVYREAMSQGFHVIAYQYGLLKPRYPMPVTETDNALAMPYEYVMPEIKALVVRWCVP